MTEEKPSWEQIGKMSEEIATLRTRLEEAERERDHVKTLSKKEQLALVKVLEKLRNKLASVEKNASDFLKKLDQMWDRTIDPFRPGGSRFNDAAGLRVALAKFDLKWSAELKAVGLYSRKECEAWPLKYADTDCNRKAGLIPPKPDASKE